MKSDISVIILAAGKGTRMKSSLPKVIHKIAGREMLNMVIDQAKILNPKNIAIVISDDLVGFQNKIIKEHLDLKIDFAIQKERKGTADAVKVGIKSSSDIADKFLILYGDTPLITANSLNNMIAEMHKKNLNLVVAGFDCFDENSYGRLILNDKGFLTQIVEFKDANEDQKKISLCNSGIMLIDGKYIHNLLSKVQNNNSSNEFYLTDVIKIAVDIGLKCSFARIDQREVLGVNSRYELAKIELIKQQELRKKHLDNGVTMINPESVYFCFDTAIENDVTIEPNVIFGKNVRIAEGCDIRSFSYIEGSEIEKNTIIGPFARLRPETKIGENVNIGNFVEIKNSKLKNNSKVNHLSYIGDSEIGKNTNIGAGTITCNYDGYKKSQTIIGDGVFVGSNSSLIAPLEIQGNSIIAAGSVVTKNVGQDDIAISRAEQINLEKRAIEYRKKKGKNEIS